MNILEVFNSHPPRAGLAGVLLPGLLVVGLLLPLGLLLDDLVPHGPAQLAGSLHADGIRSSTLRSAVLAALTALLSVALAAPLAATTQAAGRAGRAMAVGLAILPFAVPPFLTAAALGQIAVASGWSLAGTLPVGGPTLAEWLLLATLVVHGFPLAFLCLFAAHVSIGRGLHDAAATLGAGRLGVWYRVSAPLLAPAAVLGLVLVGLRSLDEAGAPLVLGVDALLAPTIIGAPTAAAATWSAAPAAALLALAALPVILAWPILRRGPAARGMGGPIQSPGGDLHESRPHRLAIVGLLPLALLTMLPLAAVWTAAAGEPQGRVAGFGALGTLWHTSWQPVVVAGGVCMLAGISLALLATTRNPVATVTRGLIVAGLAVPGVLLAVAYLALAGHRQAASGGWWLLAACIVVKQLPIVLYLVAYRLDRVPRRLLYTLAAPPSPAPLPRIRAAIAVLGPLLPALLLLGALATASELSPALVLQPVGADNPASLMFDRLHDGEPLPAVLAHGLPLSMLMLGVFAALLALAALRPRAVPLPGRGQPAGPAA